MMNNIEQGIGHAINCYSLENAIISAFNSNPYPGIIIDLETEQIISANKAFINWSGYSLDKIEGNFEFRLRLWKYPEQHDAFKAIFRSYGFVENQEVCFNNAQGSTSIFLLSAFPIIINGKSCLLSLAKDCNHDKSINESFKLDDITDQFPDINIGVGLLDKDDSIRSCNPAYAGILNVDRSLGLIGKGLIDFVPPAHREMFKAQRNIGKSRRNHLFETEIYSSKRIKKIIAVSIIPQYNNQYEYVAAFELIFTIAAKFGGEILQYSGNQATTGKLGDQVLNDFKNIAALIGISEYNYFCPAA